MVIVRRVILFQTIYATTVSIGIFVIELRSVTSATRGFRCRRWLGILSGAPERSRIVRGQRRLYVREGNVCDCTLNQTAAGRRQRFSEENLFLEIYVGPNGSTAKANNNK